MHRRSAGLASLSRLEHTTQSYAQLSHHLSTTQISSLHAQLSQFRTALSAFAYTHRDSIRKDPAFRHAFQKMCVSIGVDPLAGPRKGGWWAEMLGLGDFNYELGVQVVDVCVSTRERNGGVIEMRELVGLVGKLRGVGSEAITEEDIVLSIKTLEPLGSGYQVIEVGGRKMVRSVVGELDEDQTVVLSVARENGGRLVEDTLIVSQGWTRDRARAALDNTLLRDGLCWLDEQDETTGHAYWFFSAMDWKE